MPRARGAWWRPLNLRSTASGQRYWLIYAKALGDPIRLQLVDVLAAHPGELCACELLPLFDIAQSTLSHHLKTLADAGILEIRRQGLFAYYLVRPQALAELSSWLVSAAPPEGGVITAASQRDGTGGVAAHQN